jgi:hypothetical protein
VSKVNRQLQKYQVFQNNIEQDDFIAKHSRLVVDTRNAMKEISGFTTGKIIKA